MLRSTLDHLACPQCRSPKLSFEAIAGSAPSPTTGDIMSGEIHCPGCDQRYPILAGVAVLVEDVGGYLQAHAKGISREVGDDEIPEAYRKAFIRARRDQEREGAEHIEEDLEAERVNALYVMTHYLTARGAEWWKPDAGAGSPLMNELIREHWDQGPIAKISEALAEEPDLRLVELGCGAGGLAARLRPARYLGVDSSFASIRIARHLVCGAALKQPLRIPADLLAGPVSRAAPLTAGRPVVGADFVVGDVETPPLKPGRWSATAALNLIDMMVAPERLPALQHELLEPGGRVIQSGPYIWHPDVAAHVRELVGSADPRVHQDSARAVEWIYEQAGFAIELRLDHVPWLFFKHQRQIELYSVHVLFGRKAR